MICSLCDTACLRYARVSNFCVYERNVECRRDMLTPRPLISRHDETRVQNFKQVVSGGMCVMANSVASQRHEPSCADDVLYTGVVRVRERDFSFRATPVRL